MGISLKDFAHLQARLEGGKSPAEPVLRPSARTAEMVVLGVDPSLRATGFGIIHSRHPALTLLAQGTIKCPARWERSRCFALISSSIEDLLKTHKPAICVVEGLFYSQNLQTALLMGEVRGAALATIARHGLEIYEIATRKVKQAMVGYGAAQKHAVGKMVQRLLHLTAVPAPDAADALALALTFVHETGKLQISPRKRI